MISDQAFHIAIQISEWLNPIVHFIGLAVCIWAFRTCRKPAYLIVATYFLLATGNLVLGPTIKRALSSNSSVQPPLHIEELQRYEDEMSALHEKYFPPTPEAPAGIAKSVNIKFPLGPILLVAGLWMLARRDGLPSA